MRILSKSKNLSTLASVVLFFFAWSYLPLYSCVAAYAATVSRQAADSRTLQTQEQKKTAASQLTTSDGHSTAGERFEKTVSEIRENLGKAGEKSQKNVEPSEELAAIKTKRASLEKLASALKNDFAATEKKLKDAKLPKEILDRHYKFVKHYEDNLKELRANLDDVEQAKTISDCRAKIEIAMLHLEKVKTPSRHQKLDPNNLPNKMVKAKARAPRLKKEDFDKDFSPQRPLRSARTADLEKFYGSAFRTAHSALNHKPILVASNGPLAGLLSTDPTDKPALPLSEVLAPSAVNDIIPNSELGTPNYQVALGTSDAPTADDLAETSEVQFTQDIKDLAAQLGNKPTKIFEWVQNNIEFVPTYGSIQGADMCLQSKQCNSIDTASLLLALLRTSNIPAHYVYGTIEVPIDKLMNWAGGFTDPMAAVNFIASGGIPIRPVIVGGKISKVQMEQASAEAYIPYGNYRGSGTDDSLKTWIPMDGSFKQYTYTNGFDITATVPFDSNAYMSQVQSQNPVHYYQSQIQGYLDANMPDTSIVDVTGYREITQEVYHFLPSTLSYIMVAQLGKFSSIPDGMTAKVTFTLSSPVTGREVSFRASTPELAGKRITVSYIPATANDEALINNYGGYIYGVPAYMLNLTPVLRIQGEIKLSGETTTMGSDQTLTIQFSQPAGNLNESVQKRIVSGTYYAVGLDFQGMSETVVGKRNNTLTSNALSESAGTLGKDEFIGEYLYIRALMYFFANDKIYRSGAKIYNTVVTRTISESVTSFPLNVSQIFGMAKAVSPAGVEIDVAMNRIIAISKNSDTIKEKSYMDIAGLTSSYHEHSLFENIDGFASVSAVRALQVASANGIPIQRINSSNIGQLLPVLQVTAEIKTDIQNAVNAGKEVTIPQANVQIDDWQGVGYIVKDTITGSGAYMISGGLGGGSSTSNLTGKQVAQAFVSVLDWVIGMLSYALGGTIAEAAELDIGEQIVRGALAVGIGTPYGTDEGEVDCSELVRRAYRTAGICLDDVNADCVNDNLRTKYGITSGNGVSIFKQISVKQEGFRMYPDPSIGNAPMAGDMIFWDDTYDPDKDCVSGHKLTHMGIVQQLNVDSDKTMFFIHASSSDGVVEKKPMNIYSHKGDGSPYNTPLRTNCAPCIPCAINMICSSTSDGCSSCGKNSQRACSKATWTAAAPKYAGGLFAGFGTVRKSGPIIWLLPSH